MAEQEQPKKLNYENYKEANPDPDFYVEIETRREMDYNAGFDIGHTTGKETGYMLGHSDGFDAGRLVGHTDGYKEAKDLFTPELKKAYDSGFEDGKNYVPPVEPEEPKLPEFNKTMGNVWGPFQDPADFDKSLKLCLIHNFYGSKRYYGPGKSEGYKSDSTEPADNEIRDQYTTLRTWAGSWGIPVIQPIINFTDIITSKGTLVEIDPGKIEDIENRLYATGAAFHPYLTIKVPEAFGNELFGSDWLMKNSRDRKTAITGIDVTPTHSCVLYDESDSDSPIFVLRLFIRQVVQLFGKLAKVGMFNGATITADFQTDEWRMGVEETSAARPEMSQRWFTDKNRYHESSFQNWLLLTFERIENLNAYLAQATKIVEGSKYTFMGIAVNYKAFNEVQMSFNRGTTRFTWLDHLTEAFQALVNKLFYEHLYDVLKQEMLIQGVPRYYIDAFNTTAVFGQPVFGNQSPYTGQIPIHLLSEKMRVWQANPAPNQPGQQIGDLLASSHNVRDVQANIDLHFLRTMIVRSTANPKQGWSPLFQYRALHQSGVKRFGVRTPTDNPGDNPRVQPYLKSMFEEIEKAGFFKDIPQIKYVDSVEFDELLLLNNLQVAAQPLTDWAAKAKADKGGPLTFDGRNWDKRVAMFVRTNLLATLPKCVYPNGKQVFDTIVE